MEELLKALRLIKNTCCQHERCSKCPLCTGESKNGFYCYMDDKLPYEWELVDEAPKIKLFKEN